MVELPKSQGGLALPDFRYYYWACNINKLLFWNTCKAVVERPQWALLEISSSHLCLWSVVCSQLPLLVRQVSPNSVVMNTLMIWNQFRKAFGLHTQSYQSPIFRNHLFVPSCSDPAFRTWSEKGLVTLNDLYVNGVFPSFSDLAAKFDLPNTHLFRFFQIRHYVKSCFPQFPNSPPKSLTDQFLTLNARQRGLIGITYKHIHSLSPSCLNSLRAAWGQDLGVLLSDEQWGSLILYLCKT